jgi:hypothetical protein
VCITCNEQYDLQLSLMSQSLSRKITNESVYLHYYSVFLWYYYSVLAVCLPCMWRRSFLPSGAYDRGHASEFPLLFRSCGQLKPIAQSPQGVNISGKKAVI